MEHLDVDEEIAVILAQEGFSSLEEIAYVPANELVQIEEFDEEIVEELRGRARDVLLTRAIVDEEELSDAKPEDDLLEVEGMDEELAKILASHDVVTRDDLAELATDELMELVGVEEEKAGSLIMSARAHWFADEQQG